MARLFTAFINFYRTEKLFPITWLYPGFKLERKWDYTCYLLFKVLISLSLILSACLLVDGFFRLDFLIPAHLFLQDKTVFFDAYQQVMTPMTLVLALGFYGYVRFSIKDMKTAKIPYIKNRKFLETASKGECLWLSFVMILAGCFIVFFPHLPAFYLTNHFGFQDSLTEMFLIHLILMPVMPLMASLSIHMALFFEKTLVGYPSLKTSIHSMSKISLDDW